MKTGDMPDDRIRIGPEHVLRAERALDFLLDRIRNRTDGKSVVSVYGGSGVGKSEIASILGTRLEESGFPSYVLSGDNYPYRVPEDNDRERLLRYRYAGLTALAEMSSFNSGRMAQLKDWWERGEDPRIYAEWLEPYRLAAGKALDAYLGSPEEIDFDLLNRVIRQFRDGASMIPLKRMGRGFGDWYLETVDFRGVSVLIIEWTHGNSPHLRGVDYPIFLYSSPEETLAHRLARGRDRGADSPFTSLVLILEQAQLNRRAGSAELILSLSGETMSPEDIPGYGS